jgi:hypothetical protein
MPAQTTTARTVYYSENDEAPILEARLDDGTTTDGVPNYIDLSGSTVRIRIAHARWSYYYSPAGTIIDGVTEGLCVIDPDQVTNKGKLTWTPGAGELSPAGTYHYVFLVTFPGGERQTFPPNTYLPMVIRANVGGTI